ncbi:unnamed protein product, partial [Larinioides sclopetarius]
MFPWPMLIVDGNPSKKNVIHQRSSIPNETAKYQCQQPTVSTNKFKFCATICVLPFFLEDRISSNS